MKITDHILNFHILICHFKSIQKSSKQIIRSNEKHILSWIYSYRSNSSFFNCSLFNCIRVFLIKLERLLKVISLIINNHLTLRPTNDKSSWIRRTANNRNTKGRIFQHSFEFSRVLANNNLPIASKHNQPSIMAPRMTRHVIPYIRALLIIDLAMQVLKLLISIFEKLVQPTPSHNNMVFVVRGERDRWAFRGAFRIDLDWAYYFEFVPFPHDELPVWGSGEGNEDLFFFCSWKLNRCEFTGVWPAKSFLLSLDCDFENVTLSSLCFVSFADSYVLFVEGDCDCCNSLGFFTSTVKELALVINTVYYHIMTSWVNKLIILKQIQIFSKFSIYTKHKPTIQIWITLD